MSFIELAEARFISSAKKHVGQLQWNLEADEHHGAAVPASISELLQLLPRRGLEPRLVDRLFDLFPARPLERALLAWDIARGTLLGRNDGPLLKRLATEIAPLTQFGATGHVAVPRELITKLVEAHRLAGDIGLAEYAALPSLAALVATSAAFNTLDDKPHLVEATLAHAKRLSLAHLPSLALAFLQVLWDRFAVHKALDLMIEIALDFRLLEAVPQIDMQDADSLQRKAYGMVRAKLLVEDLAGASALLDSLASGTGDSADPSLFVARVELALLQNMRFDAVTIQSMEAIAPPESGWRYAVLVRDAITLRTYPDQAAPVLARFISRFGNSAEVWSRAAQHAGARAELLRRLSLEIRYVPHDPVVWRALSILASPDDAIDLDVQKRLDSQVASVRTRTTTGWKRRGL